MTRACFTACPFCGYEHERATAITKNPAPKVEPRMKPGDATLCIRCGEFSVMGFSEMLRRPSPEEGEMLARDPAVRLVREAWRESLGKRTQ
jgi:ferredoxin